MSTLPEVSVSGGDGPGALPSPPLAETQPPAPEAKPYASGDGATEGWAAPEVRRELWWLGGTLYRWRWVIIGVTAVAAALSVWYALSLDNQYRAETRVLMPEKSPGVGGLLDSVVPGASALLGAGVGGGGGYTRYLAILTSRSTLEEIVDRFDLVRVYDTTEDVNPQDKAVAELTKRAAFEVSLELDYLSISVLDESPDRSAQIANAFVEILNERHIAFSSGSAGDDRRFLGERLDEAQLALDSSLNALQAFQERNGVIEIESQAAAFMESVGTARGQIAEAEVRYDALRSQFGDDNPDVQTARAALESARRSLGSLTGGGEAVMPVPMRDLPAVGRQYAAIYQELETQKQIVTALRPMYEQAVLSERRDADAVQVLDPAVAPSKKAEPRRSILVLSMTAAAGLLACLLVLVVSWWRQRRSAFVQRLQAAS